MKLYAWMGLIAASALSGGCVPSNYVLPTVPPPGMVDKTGKAIRPQYQPAVTAGQISGANAHDKAQALREEIEADLIPATEPGDAKKGKE